MKEIEVKILGISVEDIEKKIMTFGGKLHFKGELHALFFDDKSRRIKADEGVLRLRKEGDTSMLTHKKKLSKEGTKIMEEHETAVESLDSTRKILEALGMEVVNENRKFRTEYILNEAKVVIDIYCDALTFIPPFLEIEAVNEALIFKVAQSLGYKPSDCLNWDTYDLMKHYQTAKQ